MKNFVRRAVRKLPKLDNDQVKKIIEILSDENDLMETVIDSLEYGVLVTDNEHRLRVVSKPARRLLSMRSGNLENLIIWTVVQDSEICEYLEKELLAGNRIHDEEFYCKAGSTNIILSISMFPYLRERKIHGSILVVRDITEMRQREAKYRRAENLASLTTLAAGVAHEIKNPLASIGIHLQLMRKELNLYGCLKKESAEEYLVIIDEEIERLNGIVVDFLFAVRPMDTRMKPEDINRLAEETTEFIKYELEQNGIQLDFLPGKGLPKIDMDVKYMKQVLLNIIKNAIAAMPNGCKLIVRTFRKDEFIHIQIEDNGVGISEENMAKIFEPYFTTKDFGSGLGLTVVYKIIKEHRGEISLDSREGKGTVFTISLPLPQSELSLLEWEG